VPGGADDAGAPVDVVVVGAGLAGLAAAGRLEQAGCRVVLVDKGRSVGGRLATRRVGGASLDHGAQFFTVRSDAFRREVDRWLAEGVVHEWCRGFDDRPDGHPRYAAAGGLNRVAKHLAAPLADVRTGVQVTSVGPGAPAGTDDGWRVAWAGGELRGRAVIVSAPVPQALDLLAGGSTELRAEVGDALRAIRYEPTIALLLVLDRPPAVPAPGARKPADGPFEIVVDNVAKGTSREPALTLHLRPELSAARDGDADERILDDLLPAAARWIGGASVTASAVKRWRYATPIEPWPEATVAAAVGPTGPVLLAGDAFAGPRVEGAWSSGIAAAEELLTP
jgi:hypothetical protein